MFDPAVESHNKNSADHAGQRAARKLGGLQDGASLDSFFNPKQQSCSTPTPGANPMREKIGRYLRVWGLHYSFSEVWDCAGADHNLCRARLSSLCNGPGRILAAWLGTARHLGQTL